MKYKDFLAALQQHRFNDDDEVVIQVSRGSPAIGPHHTVAITGVGGGIDWDSGRIFLQTSEPVAVKDKQTEQAKAFYDRVIQSWAYAKTSKQEKQFTHTLKAHFKDMLEKTGMGAYIEEQLRITEELHIKVQEAREKAKRET